MSDTIHLKPLRPEEPPLSKFEIWIGNHIDSWYMGPLFLLGAVSPLRPEEEIFSKIKESALDVCDFFREKVIEANSYHRDLASYQDSAARNFLGEIHRGLSLIPFDVMVTKPFNQTALYRAKEAMVRKVEVKLHGIKESFTRYIRS